MPPLRTIFGEILDDVVRQIPGALAAVFADWEGETVDMARSPLGDDSSFFDGQLAAAHWGVVYNGCRQRLSPFALGEVEHMMLRFERQQVLVARVTSHYYLTLVLKPEVELQRALELFQRGRERLAEEM